MELTKDVLVMAILAYSVVFTLIGLFFFRYVAKATIRLKEMVESVIALIDKVIDKEEEAK